MISSKVELKRRLRMVLPPGQSAFIWGARQTGKSTYLKGQFPDSLRFDLLLSDVYLTLLKEPWRLREEILAADSNKLKHPVIIDEVQKIPALLDEVHWLIANHDIGFILCGSSARKLKKEAANLLGGRAWRFEMFPLVYPEIPGFDLLRALSDGLLPTHYLGNHPRKSLQAYVQDYLTEEIKAEGLARNLAAFSRFLDAAAFSHGQMVQYRNIASDCGVDGKTVKEYFDILVDTHLGFLLPPFSPRHGRKSLNATPKFYFFDTGVANYLCQTRFEMLKGTQAGVSFESYILHELRAYRAYADLDFTIHYWRAVDGNEVDFVLNRGETCIETTISAHVKSGDLRGLRTFLAEQECKRAYVVCLEKRKRQMTTPEGKKITVLSWNDFLETLWGGGIVWR